LSLETNCIRMFTYNILHQRCTQHYCRHVIMRCTCARDNWNLLPHGNRTFPTCFCHHSTNSSRWLKNYKKLSINSQWNTNNTFTMRNGSFILRTKLLFQSNFRQDWLNGIMSSYFIQESHTSLNQRNNIFIGKPWLRILQTSPRHAKNDKFSSNNENIMDNFCQIFMISILGIKCA